MKKVLILFTAFIFTAVLLWVVKPFASMGTDEDLILYSGRSKALIEPLIKEFEDHAGIRVRVRYGGTTQLAAAIEEEGQRSPADLFWAQDPGALGSLNRNGILRMLPNDLTGQLPEIFRNSAGTWVATSGRARVVAYSSTRMGADDLPSTVFGLTAAEWQGRVGWAPSNASFQAFVTAMRKTEGEERTRQWLEAMRTNGAESYPNNTSIIQAIAAGEIDTGLTNHYYLLRFLERDPDFPVAQTFLDAGDPANLIIVSGIGVLETSRNEVRATRFIEFLLSPAAQNFFSREIFEYPVTPGADQHPDLLPFETLVQTGPNIDLDALEDLDGTLRLLRATGLL